MRTRYFVALAWLASACGQTADPITADYLDLPADQIMTGVTHAPTSEGIRSAIGKYDTVYVFEDSSKLHLKGVNLEMFDATGRKTATLTSLTGELNTSTEAMVARGSVRLVTTTDNRVIETEELHYDPNTRRIWSDVATTMRLRGDVTHSDGFKADDQFEKVEIVRPRGAVPGVKVEF
jgi:LPS export ABC transporter protein LptC